MTFAAVVTSCVATINDSIAESIDDRDGTDATPFFGNTPKPALLVNHDWLFASIACRSPRFIERREVDPNRWTGWQLI